MAQALSPLKKTGFSLFEILITLSLICILSTATLLSWHNLKNHWKQRTLLNQIQGGLSFARLTAVSKQKNTIYCGSQDNFHCDGHWQKGQLVKFQSGKILHAYPALPAGATLTYHGNFGRNLIIQFNNQGFTEGQQGHFEICLNECTRLTLHFSGSVTLATITP